MYGIAHILLNLDKSDCSTTVLSDIRGAQYLVWPHTFVSPSADSRRAVVSYWRKYVHEVLVNRLGGLSLPRKSVFRLTDRSDMTLDVKQQQQQLCLQLGYNSLNIPLLSTSCVIY